ncbi:MAG: TonB-dependent receptor [Nitrospiraceae bacterium]|nr:TonB-dependent receptor [Nitrospiraceae bacterium]
MGKRVVSHAVRSGVTIATFTVVLLSFISVSAAEPPGAEPPEKTPTVYAPEVVYSATRTPTTLGSLNQSVTIVTEEQIQQQLAVSPGRSLGQILPKLVPGMSQNDGSMDSGTSQTIRGRQIAVLIDGVPQLSSPTTQLDLAHIDPSAIERIEIVRGATAIYGNGATGGLINIITKQAGEGKTSFYTDVQGSGSLTRVLRGLSGTVVQGVQGKKDWFDYNLVGTFNNQGGMFDAEGSRTMPGTNGVGGFADTKSYNILGKFGATFGEHRLQLTFNRKESRQDTNYFSDPGVDALPRTTARFIPGLALDEQPKLTNSQISVDYSHPHLFLDSSVHIQGYYRSQRTRFPTFDVRPFGGTEVLQGLPQTDVLGTRAEITTPIPLYGKPQVTWGMDFSSQHGDQRQNLYDPAILDASGGRIFSKIAQTPLVPSRVFQTAAAFAQGEWTPLAALVLRGGVRYERLGISSSDFTDSVGNVTPAGSIKFDTTVFNAGFVYHLIDPLDLFFNFSQGFNVPVGSIDAALTGVTPGTNIALTKLQPQRTNNYELGLRGKWSKVQSSLSGFITKSSLGLNFDQFTNSLQRAPQSIYGVEATLDVQPYEGWRIGGSYTFVEGDQTIAFNPDVRTPINGFNIQPQKITGYLEHLTVPEWQWRNRLQVLYSGSRTRSNVAFASGLDPIGDPFSMTEYFVVDFIATVKAGPGTLRFGIENLLNQNYVAAFNQISFTNSFNYAARGTTATIGYSIAY